MGDFKEIQRGGWAPSRQRLLIGRTGLPDFPIPDEVDGPATTEAREFYAKAQDAVARVGQRRSYQRGLQEAYQSLAKELDDHIAESVREMKEPKDEKLRAKVEVAKRAADPAIHNPVIQEVEREAQSAFDRYEDFLRTHLRELLCELEPIATEFTERRREAELIPLGPVGDYERLRSGVLFLIGQVRPFRADDVEEYPNRPLPTQSSLERYANPVRKPGGFGVTNEPSDAPYPKGDGEIYGGAHLAQVRSEAELAALQDR